MTILLTGAAGFLGRRLAQALLADGTAHGPSRVLAADLLPCDLADARLDVRAGSIADPAFVRSVVTEDVRVVYHLAAVLSGQAEAEFEAGMRVNVDATRDLLEACRCLPHPPRFVFASTIAVYGGTLPPVVPEDLVLRPQSSYGTGKAIGELLVADYSRRGYVDGVVCRVPTVAVRPGRPNSALSSFVSGIVREPLAGIDTVCPVPLDSRLWVSSPGTVVRNLVHAGRLPAQALEGRIAVNLPGLSVTPREMLESLERMAGPAVRARVRCEPDDRVIRVVTSWPGAFDTGRAEQLGFAGDADIDALIREFMHQA